MRVCKHSSPHRALSFVSSLVFKDRDRYVSGEYRFRNGYAKSNPRKMVKLWAEKETRNLRRLHAAGIPCPNPLLLRLHVLVMDFFGRDGVAAPRLKDAGLSGSKLAAAYDEVVRLMRQMFVRCRLVHADLSEYNMLHWQGHVVIIDVSQSVETDHPRALEFLRMVSSSGGCVLQHVVETCLVLPIVWDQDCQNVSDFFRRGGVPVMTPRELFDFCVHLSLPTEADEEAYLREVRTTMGQRCSFSPHAHPPGPVPSRFDSPTDDGASRSARVVVGEAARRCRR